MVSKLFEGAQRQRETTKHLTRPMISRKPHSLSGTALLSLTIVFACSTLLQPAQIFADPIPVRHIEGFTHGFLVLRSLAGETLADGDLIQSASRGRLTTQLIFHFKDGSVSDETAVFSQRGNFRLLRDHLIQKGPTFPRPMDVQIDGSAGKVTVRTTDGDGTEKVVDERMSLPGDVSNGVIFTLMKNIRSDASQVKVSMVAAFRSRGSLSWPSLLSARSPFQSAAPVAKPCITS